MRDTRKNHPRIWVSNISSLTKINWSHQYPSRTSDTSMNWPSPSWPTVTSPYITCSVSPFIPHSRLPFWSHAGPNIRSTLADASGTNAHSVEFLPRQQRKICCSWYWSEHRGREAQVCPVLSLPSLALPDVLCLWAARSEKYCHRRYRQPLDRKCWMSKEHAGSESQLNWDCTTSITFYEEIRFLMIWSGTGSKRGGRNCHKRDLLSVWGLLFPWDRSDWQ